MKHLDKELDLAFFLIKENREKHAAGDPDCKRLELVHCGLTEIPEELFENVWLEELILSNVRKKPGSKKRLESANKGEQNSLSAIPQGLKKLNNLNKLWIGGDSDEGRWEISKIEYLPESLTFLDISYNQIKKLENIPPELKQLIIRYNNVSKLESIPDNITYLNIRNNYISKLENLPYDLTFLNISKNKIERLENLPPKLTDLKIFSNEIEKLESLPESLKFLDIGSNQIVTLNQLNSGLNYLRIGNNKLTSLENLPSTIESLDVRYNKISDLTPIKDSLLELKVEIIWNFNPGKKQIAVAANPLTTPPPEIVKRGNEAVIEYFKQLEKKKIKLYESKLLIVGQGEVGKTWLMHRLISGKTPEDGKTTEGIDIRTWHFDNQDIKDFRVNFWDFGGQEIYHATHQFFLTKRSLYLFVWDARKEQDIITSFDYWLNVISLLSMQSPVIVVMNKFDERTKAIEEETLKKRFGNIIAFHKVSAMDGTGIEALKAGLVKHIAALPQVGTELPKVWNDIRLELEGLGKNTISLKEYNEICGSHGLNPTEAAFIGDYYHDLGVFLHFRDNAILRDIIFLNPEWATTAVYKIIDTKDVQKANGHFNYGKLKEIWQEYDEDKYKYLLELMKRFELCYQIGNSEHYIVPELLRPEYPELEWDYTDNLRFELRYDFMPAGIVTRVITRRNHQIKDEICWRNGLVIERNNSEALIISDPIKRKISIWIRGDERKEMLYLIRDEIDQIHETLNFPAFKAMYPCICSECKTSDAPHFFDSSVLVKFMLKEKLTAECQKSGEDVNIEELRGSIMSNTDFAYDAILSISRTNQEMLHKVIEMLTVIKSNQPDKDTVLDEFFKVVPLDFGLFNAGELLKKLLRFRKERLDGYK
jgi:internalin A